MIKIIVPQDILNHKEEIALMIFNEDLHQSPSLVAYKEKYIQDTIYSLRFLSTSLEVDEPLLFQNYMNWFGSLAYYLRFNATSMDKHFDVFLKLLNQLCEINLFNSAKLTFELGIKSFRDAMSSTRLNQVEYDEFLNHLIAMHSELAYDHILKLIDDGMSLKNIYLNVLQPTLYKVGDLWQQRIISVAKEHYITAAIQHIIGRLYSKLFAYRERSKYTVTAVCAGDELHEIGMRMVADFFELSGWDSIFLGSNIPINIIINQLLEHPTDLLAVSATTSAQLLEVRDLIDTVKTDTRLNHIKIIVGGRVFNETPNLWKSLKADGHALDAEQAVVLGMLLIGEHHENN